MQTCKSLDPLVFTKYENYNSGERNRGMQEKTEWLYIPQNLNIEALLDENKTSTPKYFKKDSAFYVIDTILNARSSQRKEMEENNTLFANISTKTLQAVVTDYLKYIKFFLAIGIIETDNHYKVGEKSKGYKMCDEYSGQKLKRVQVTDKRLLGRIQAERERRSIEDKSLMDGYEYLTKWWESGKHDISIIPAVKWIQDYTDRKISGINKNSRLTKKKRKQKVAQAIDTREDFIKLICAFKDKRSVRFKGLGKRLYNPLCNLKRELRGFITYDGKPLVEIDIKNSQPFFSLILFDKSFWSSDTDTFSEKINIGKTSKEIDNKIYKYKDIIMSEKILSNHEEESYEKYKNLVREAEFYEYMGNIFKIFNPTIFENNKVKTAVLTTMYLDNKRSTYHEASKNF